MKRSSTVLEEIRNHHPGALDKALDESIQPRTESRVFVGVTDHLTRVLRNMLSASMINSMLDNIHSQRGY